MTPAAAVLDLRSRRCPTAPPGLIDPMFPRQSCNSMLLGAIFESGSL